MSPGTLAACAVLAVASTAAGTTALDFLEPERESERPMTFSTARGFLAVDTSVGPVRIRVLPARGETGSPFVAGPVDGTTLTRRGYVRLLHGRVGDRVASVEIHLGGEDPVTIEPAAGFFLRELAEDDELIAVVARGPDGAELDRRSMRARFRRDLPRATGPYRRMIELETSEGFPMTLAVAPGTNGTVCTETRYRGTRAGGCNQPPPDTDAINVGRSLWNEDEDRKTTVRLLQGSIGRKIERLEVWYEQGAARVPIVEQHVLFEIPPRRVPKLLVGLDAKGRIVARRLLR
jgi:hypothetical protein